MAISIAMMVLSVVMTETRTLQVPAAVAGQRGRGSIDQPRRAEPLVIDLDGDGFNLTNARDGILFPIRVDMSREQIAWTTAGGRDAFLAIDNTRGGVVSSVYNLFGGVHDVNGFAELIRVEREIEGRQLSREPDGIIDERDEVFSRLFVWLDLNHNGVSDGEELRSLKSAGITSLFLGYEQIDKRDRNGNLLRFKGHAIVRNNHDVPVAREMCAVRFAGSVKP